MQRIRNFIKWWNRPNKSVIADWIQSLLVVIPFAFLVRTWFYGLYKVPSGSMETTLLVGESLVSDKFTYTFLRKPQRGEIIAFNEPTYPYSKNPFKNWWQHYVWGPDNFTKRLIGIPGDHIKGTLEDGRPVIYLNGERLDEPYLNQYPLVLTDTRGTYRSYDAHYSYEKQPFYRMNRTHIKMIKKMMEPLGLPGVLYPQTASTPNGRMVDIFEITLKTKEKDGVDEYWGMGDNRLGSSDCRSFGPIPGNFIHGRIFFRLFSVDSSTSWMIMDLLRHPIDFWSRVRWSRWMQFVK